MTLLDEVTEFEGARNELMRITGEGRRWKWTLDNGAAYLRIWSDSTGYHVDYSALKQESTDDDSGSMNCGCPLQGKCHFHKHVNYPGVLPAAKALASAARSLTTGKPLKFDQLGAGENDT